MQGRGTPRRAGEGDGGSDGASPKKRRDEFESPPADSVALYIEGYRRGKTPATISPLSRFPSGADPLRRGGKQRNYSGDRLTAAAGRLLLLSDVPGTSSAAVPMASVSSITTSSLLVLARSVHVLRLGRPVCLTMMV